MEYRQIARTISVVTREFVCLSSGSCVASGYSDCCEVGFCGGYPANCFCDANCYGRGDCCDDITTTCTTGQFNPPTTALFNPPTTALFNPPTTALFNPPIPTALFNPPIPTALFKEYPIRVLKKSLHTYKPAISTFYASCFLNEVYIYM